MSVKTKEKKTRYKGTLRLYITWPLILTLLLLAGAFGIYFINARAGYAAFGVTFIYAVIALSVRFYNRRSIANDLVNFATSFGQVQKGLLKGLALPYALLDENGRFVWCN